MKSQSILADVGPYYAVTIDPFQGVFGLSLYKNKMDDKKEIEKYLKYAKRYCEVFIDINNPEKAINIDASTYDGLAKVFRKPEEREKWIENIKLVLKTINQILLSFDDKKVKVSTEDIENSIKILTDLEHLAQERMAKPESEIFYAQYRIT